MVARDTPHRRVTRSTPYALSVEGETWRLIASTSGGPKGGRPPVARSWPRAARSPSSARPPSPSGGRSRCLGRPPADSSVRPRRRRGTRRASRSARRPSPRARARPAPGPRRAAAAGPPPACGPPTCAAAAWARARLRQRVGRAPPGPRPPRPRRPSSTSSRFPNRKSVSQRTVGRGTGRHPDALRAMIRRGKLQGRKNNAGQWLVQIPPGMLAESDSADDPDMAGGVAGLRDELLEARGAAARAEAERDSAVANLADARSTIERERVRGDRLEAALAEARRPWLAKVIEGLRRRS